MFCGNRPHYWNSPGSNDNYCLRCGLQEGQADYVLKLEAELDTERSMRHEAQSDYGNLMGKTEILEAQVARLQEALEWELGKNALDA